MLREQNDGASELSPRVAAMFEVRLLHSETAEGQRFRDSVADRAHALAPRIRRGILKFVIQVDSQRPSGFGGLVHLPLPPRLAPGLILTPPTAGPAPGAPGLRKHFVRAARGRSYLHWFVLGFVFFPCCGGLRWLRFRAYGGGGFGYGLADQANGHGCGQDGAGLL